MMKSLLRLLIITSVILNASPALAVCYGGGNFTSCNDPDGNNYIINKFGNVTTIARNNFYTGAHWNEIVQRDGNTTYENGNANGGPWDMRTVSDVGVKTINGINAQGQLLSYTCNPGGSCTGYR